MKLKNFSKKWKWITGIIVAALAILLFGRLHSNSGTLFPPRHVSFVQQAHGTGTHIWYMATGKDKDANVYYIVVLKDGRARTYRTYDDDTTLGKIAKMSNRQVLRYAKQQDKKYFDVSTKEVALARRGVHDGFNADFKPAMSAPSYYVLINDDNKVVGTAIDTGEKDRNDRPYQVIFNTAGKMTSSARGTTQLPSNIRENYTPIVSENDIDQRHNTTILKRMDTGLQEHIRQVSYTAPEPIKVKNTSQTDASGNHIVSQTATIQYTSSVDVDQVQDNFLQIAEKDPSIMKRFAQWATLKQKVHDPKQVAAAQTAVNKGIDKMFSPHFCNDLTKEVFISNEQEKDTLSLEMPVAFDVYDSHFIGYERANDNGYLITKAQSKKQTAVFAK